MNVVFTLYKFEPYFPHFRKLQQRAEEKRRLAELEDKTVGSESDQSEHELGPPLNQQPATEKIADQDIPDLEKVDIETMKSDTPEPEIPEVAPEVEVSPKMSTSDPFEADMVDLTGLRAQSAPPKGFRNVQIELESGDESDSDNDFEIIEKSETEKPICLDDLPDLSPAEPEVLDAGDNSMLNIIKSEVAKNPITEMLFTKVEKTEKEPKVEISKKPLIQELDSDDELL